MLYQGAIRFMKKAILNLEQKDMEGKGNALIRAQDIILELTYALDQESLDRGDELALNLQRLYLYSYRRLVHANVRMEIEPIQEVIGLMGELLEAWEQILQSEGVETTGTAPMSPGLVITG